MASEGDSLISSPNRFTSLSEMDTDLAKSQEMKLRGMTIFWIVVVVLLLLVLLAIVIVAIVTFDKNKKNKSKGGQTSGGNNNAAMIATQNRKKAERDAERMKSGAKHKRNLSDPKRYQDDEHRQRRNEYMQNMALMSASAGGGAAVGAHKRASGGKDPRLPMMQRGTPEHSQMKEMMPNAASQLDEESLKDILQPGKPISCIMFYSPGCGACKSTYPRFQQAASMRPAVSFHVVDCTQLSQAMNQAFGIDFVPKIVRVHPSQTSYVEYKGDRSPDDMVKFAQQSQGIGEMKKYA